ncbi:MAG: hypothetical protein F4Z01_04580 [Gammaproteobacteria bacterium]|nr:hypothetical protein [Gammaproteobacteria bacterium]MYF38616.1 hypothetical protein [Gammaproteobacteria bacterium]
MVPNGDFLEGLCLSIFEIDAAGGAWNFVGDLVNFGSASAFRSTSGQKSTRERHRVVVPERLHPICRSEFSQIEA